MFRHVRGYIDPVIALVIVLVVILAVVFFHKNVSSVMIEGLRASQTRSRVYEFVRCFTREAQTAGSITATADGRGLQIEAAATGAAVDYKIDNASGQTSLYADDLKLFDAAGAELGYDGQMARASFRLRGNTYDLYGASRISWEGEE